MIDFDFNSFLLAQDGAVGPPGETTAAPGTATGQGAGTGTGGGSSPFGGTFMFVMLGMLVLMIVVSGLGPRRERKRRQAMLTAIKKHDKVQTVGGVIGAIVEIKPDLIVLKVDESSNTRITFARSSIQQVLNPSEEPASPELTNKG